MSLVKHLIVDVVFAVALVIFAHAVDTPVWPMLGAYALGGLVVLVNSWLAA